MEIREVNQSEFDGLISRIEDAIDNNLALSTDDLRLLLSAIHTLTELQNRLEDNDITLQKLRKLLGLVKKSESRKNKNNKGNNNSNRPKGSSNKPKPVPKVIPVEHHPMTTHQKGDVCSVCQKGKLYKFQVLEFIRITAHAPFEAKKHVIERFRCNLCQTIFTADVPEAVTEDGPLTQKYGYSARSAMAIEKFYSGLAYNHQEMTSLLRGLRISSSTIYDQVSALSEDITPAYRHLQYLAAQAEIFLFDDTGHKILSQEPQEKVCRDGKTRTRSGIYCSGLIAYTVERYEIVLFEISLGHAGEHVDSILAKRVPELPKPKVMSDALNSNSVKACPVETGNCNSHGRRNFFDIENQFPEAVEYVLDEYAKIWQHERTVKELKLDDDQRLAYHIEHSLPVMESLKTWCEDQISKSDYEAHSGLGKAIRYFLNHYEALISFCKYPGMPIDNNRMEETLKIIIRGRKSYMFFKTVAGATVANIISSLIMTAHRCNENPFEYLTALQQYKVDQKSHPELWMPWNFRDRMKQLKHPPNQSTNQTNNTATNTQVA